MDPLTVEEAFARLDCFCPHHHGVTGGVRQWRCPECVAEIAAGLELATRIDDAKRQCEYCKRGDPVLHQFGTNVQGWGHEAGQGNWIWCHAQQIREKIAEMK